MARSRESLNCCQSTEGAERLVDVRPLLACIRDGAGLVPVDCRESYGR